MERGMKGRGLVVVVLAALLAWSFWRSAGWLQLCAGLAMFLLGMQLLEEGLRQLAGGRLEQWLARSTATPRKGLLFGIGGTMLLQSSTLVSLLTIAFVSSGLIHLAAGIAVVFGANLGATSGIWLLALAGHGFSLSPLALPLLVFGVLGSFLGARGRAAGRVMLGVALIFLGIDGLQQGFGALGGNLDLNGVRATGLVGTLLFVGAGLAATVVLQSSHATLILTLTALSNGYLVLGQALAIAIGANVGSSVSTAVVGMLGGNRSGQRLALAHVAFNVTTATLALVLLVPLAWAVGWISRALGFGDNPLLQLALFHTLFNAGGVLVFWPWQASLARALERWLPDPPPAHAMEPQTPERIRAHYLSPQALESPDAAAAAVTRELQHLGQLCMEVICRTLLLPPERLTWPQPEAATLELDPQTPDENADALYQHYVKGVYADLLSFMGRLDVALDEPHQRYWNQCQLRALGFVNAVKDAKHLQKNMNVRLREPPSAMRDSYLSLWRYLLEQLHALYALAQHPAQATPEHLAALASEVAQFQTGFRQRLFLMARRDELDGLRMGSLMNDLGYVDHILGDLRAALAPGDAPGALRSLHPVVPAPDAPAPS